MTYIKAFAFKSPKYQATIVFSRDDETKVFLVGTVAAIVVMKLL